MKVSYKILKGFLLESLDSIPIDAGLSDVPEMYNGKPPYRCYEYFGNCKNTVSRVWDATQMAGWLKTCKVLNIHKVIDKLENGEKQIPKQLLKVFSTYGDKLNDMSEICCGIDDVQKIMFIYVTKYDTHFFFDCSFH